MKNYGFTLAEVLITLGIIGVVAALTLPALVQNNRNREMQTRLKRGYSVLSQALDMYQAENGERITPQTKIGWDLKPVLMKYLKTVKDCGYGSLDDDACIPNYGPDNEKNSTKYTTYNGKTLYLNYFDDGQFVLNDGSLVLLESAASATNLYISIDVNGIITDQIVWGRICLCFKLIQKVCLDLWELRERIITIKTIHIALILQLIN